MKAYDMSTERKPLDHYLGLEYSYTVVPDDGSYFIKFPDLPGCMTQVEDSAEIAAMAEEIRTLWIEAECEEGHDVPEPRPDEQYSGKFVVRMPKSLHRGLASAADREGVSLNTWVNHLLTKHNAAAALSRTSHSDKPRPPILIRTLEKSEQSSGRRGNLTIVTRSEKMG